MMTVHKLTTGFPFLFGRAFIEAITLLLRWKT